MDGPKRRGPIGYGFSQFRENWCPKCEEHFPTEPKEARPKECRLCGNKMPAKPAQQIETTDLGYRTRRRALHKKAKDK